MCLVTVFGQHFADTGGYLDAIGGLAGEDGDGALTHSRTMAVVAALGLRRGSDLKPAWQRG